jgi:hypothetical protein
MSTDIRIFKQENLMGRFARCLVALAVLATGCGGGPEIDSADVALTGAHAALDVNQLLELDLPGCECPGLLERGEEVRVHRHPFDDGLVVVDVVGRGPACIDSPRAALEALRAVGRGEAPPRATAKRPESLRASAARLAPRSPGNGGHLLRAANVAPEDDPVPIKEAQGEGGSGNDEGSDEGGDDSGHAGQSGPDQDDGRGNPGDVVKLSKNNDDPVPILEIKASVSAHLTRN